MSAQFPFPCARCGCCCMAIVCPVGLEFGGRELPCEFLTFSEDVAFCILLDNGFASKEDIGADLGCCMKGRAVNRTTRAIVDWASLPLETKRGIVRGVQEGQGAILQNPSRKLR
mgnify:CR=1 FL=1